MKRILRSVITAVLVISAVLSTTSCGVLSDLLRRDKEAEFYDTVVESQGLLDNLADDIYNNWYDAIYNDKFNNDINEAIQAAFDEHEDDLDIIFENDRLITDLYKDVRDGRLEDEAESVMEAYNEYYTVVVECSGSFNDYSEVKEPTKKTLSRALKNYYIAY